MVTVHIVLILLPDETDQRVTASDEPGSRKPPAVFCPAAEHTVTRTIVSDMRVKRIIHSPIFEHKTQNNKQQFYYLESFYA